MKKVLQTFALIILLTTTVPHGQNELAINKTDSDLPFEHSIKNNLV